MKDEIEKIFQEAYQTAFRNYAKIFQGDYEEQAQMLVEDTCSFAIDAVAALLEPKWYKPAEKLPDDEAEVFFLLPNAKVSIPGVFYDDDGRPLFMSERTKHTYKGDDIRCWTQYVYPTPPQERSVNND